ncbi:MAG TPA: hypothetical protein V6C69_22510 [Trichormus sp.]|jgi:hypothetical protein
MNVVADDRLSKRYSVIHTRLDYAAPVSNDQVQSAQELTGDLAFCNNDNGAAGYLAESPGAAFPSESGRANRKSHFSRTPIGAYPNFRRIAMG